MAAQPARSILNVPVAVEPTDPSVRDGYARLGVDAYYRRHASTYRNPHEDTVRAAIAHAVADWTPDLSHVLDLAAGSGEVTLALRELGAARIDAIDPFTADAYQQRTGAACEPLDFAAIATGALGDRRYSLIVCSFALHLCEPSRLPVLAQQLSLLAPNLLILTPHKRPILRPEWGWDTIAERVTWRVRGRYHHSTAFSLNS
jgi:SAM-dependent methyltransferase